MDKVVWFTIEMQSKETKNRALSEHVFARIWDLRNDQTN